MNKAVDGKLLVLGAVVVLAVFASVYYFGMKTPAANCSLKPDPGLCKAYMPRYFYDSSAKACKQFIWGGCGGTVPFEKLDECVKACEK